MSVVYHKRYFINFMGMPDENSSGRSYCVEFYKRGDSADAIPEVVELQGSGSPFLHSLNDSEDLLAPLRTSTARISFIDDISLQELLPKDAFEWQVRLLRLDDSKQLFIGYLTAEVYTQPNIEGPNVVTVNAASPLTPIAATTMQLVDVGSLSIGRLLHMALSECEGVDSVYIPAMYTINKATSLADFTDILHWQFSSSNFIKTSDSGIVTGELFECDTYSAALEAICKLFGWSLTDVGDGSLYFVSPGYTGRYMQIGKYQLLASGFVPTVVSPTIIDEGYLFPVDASNTIDFRQGVGSAVVTAAVSTADLDFLDIGGLVRSQTLNQGENSVYIDNIYTGEAEIFTAQYTELEAKILESRLQLKSYVLDDNNEWIEASSSPNNAGATFEKIDWFDPAMLDENAAEKKVEWNFEDVIRVKEHYDKVLIPKDYPLITAKSRGGAFSSGAFVIDFSIMASPVAGYYIPHDPYWQGGSMKEPRSGVSWNTNMVSFPYWGTTVGGGYSALNVSLRAGGKYYDGEKWVDSFTQFIIKVSNESAQWHAVISNKTLDMPYSGSSGWYIPINELLAGSVEFNIYQSFATEANLNIPEIGKLPLIPNVYIKGLTLKYVEEYSFNPVTTKDATFYKGFNSSFKEKLDVSLPLHSRINSSEQMSLVFDGFSTAIDTVWRTTATEAAKPERFLLANIERLYSRPLTSWRTASSLREVTPFDMFSKPDGVLPLMGYTINYAVGVIELHLTKVESEKELRYVE